LTVGYVARDGVACSSYVVGCVALVAALTEVSTAAHSAVSYVANHAATVDQIDHHIISALTRITLKSRVAELAILPTSSTLSIAQGVPRHASETLSTVTATAVGHSTRQTYSILQIISIIAIIAVSWTVTIVAVYLTTGETSIIAADHRIAVFTSCAPFLCQAYPAVRYLTYSWVASIVGGEGVTEPAIRTHVC